MKRKLDDPDKTGQVEPVNSSDDLPWVPQYRPPAGCDEPLAFTREEEPVFVTLRTWERLHTAYPDTLFRRNAEIVAVCPEDKVSEEGRDGGMGVYRIERISSTLMGRYLVDARIYRNDPKKGQNEDGEALEVPQYKPFSDHDVRLLMESTVASPMLREIAAAWPCAYARPYWSSSDDDESVQRYQIVREFGYDSTTATIMTWRGFQPPPLDLPEAGSYVKAMLAGTVYREPCDLIHALSLLLMPVLRPAISGPTPMYTVTGPAGAGKSFLVKLVGELLGYLDLRPLEEWGSEAERQLSSHLLSSSPMIFYDDLNPKTLGEGGTPLLCEAITAGDRPIRIRPMGKTEEQLARPRCIWAATLIEPDGLTEAAARRIVQIRIRRDDAKARVAIDQEVKRNRSLYVEALCCLVQAWSDQGCRGTPDQPAPPSFREWHEVVGHCAVWVAQQIGLSHEGKKLSPAAWASAWLAHRPRGSVNEELRALIACWVEFKDSPEAPEWKDRMTTAELARACSSSGLGLSLLGSDTARGYNDVGRQLAKLADSELAVQVEKKWYRLVKEPKPIHGKIAWSFASVAKPRKG